MIKASSEFITEPVSRMGNKRRWSENHWPPLCWNHGLHPIFTLFKGPDGNQNISWHVPGCWASYEVSEKYIPLSSIGFLFSSPDFTIDLLFGIFAESTRLYTVSCCLMYTRVHTHFSTLKVICSPEGEGRGIMSLMNKWSNDICNKINWFHLEWVCFYLILTQL